MKEIELPKNLGMNGFSDKKIVDNDLIDISLLTEIKGYIVAELTPRATINLRHSSYGLKHKCENYIGKYVSNGQFIASMILVGYKYKQDDINAYFNIKSIRN
ncbi:hypothetical protein [Flavobacterium aquidurense]|uniref:hypothetical protein n=1 Tax=Flavobacterium aquidurense TaxID=362413 RepID=UPI00090F4742|nr:hypothetical protein [Flavobacterium aquidurense]SHH84795.1 hypothetical protein SAMN05444481_1342 [Flavobacterium frigidimaris]